MDVSIIIPHHNESKSFMEEAVESITSTITTQNYEILICDDASTVPFKFKHPKVRVFRQRKHRGVGQAFDMGVKHAKSDNIFLQGSDIRYTDNKWDEIMLKEIEAHPKAATCGCCVGLNNESPEGMDISVRRNRSRRYGARVLAFHDHISHPKKPKSFRSILECQWLPVPNPTPTESYPIPAILGAFYGIKKDWYKWIGGFEFHRSWGSLESYFSLKVWFMGGECRVSPQCEVGHIFKRSGTHATPHHHLMYNKIMAATLLFDEYHANRLIDFLDDNHPNVRGGKKMFAEVKKAVMAKRKEYAEKITLAPETWCERWNVDFRLD